MEILLLSLGSYLFGNINPAIIITRIKKGIDIRSVNSQNAGATNVTALSEYSFKTKIKHSIILHDF
jgi:glycerol-3-phosphate acyltransferase PlsY